MAVAPARWTMTKYQKGDTVTLSADGKVAIGDYQYLGGFASITRTLVTDDPETEVEAMRELLDCMWHRSLVENYERINGCYEALGPKSEFLEEMLEYAGGRGELETQTEAGVGAVKESVAIKKGPIKKGPIKKGPIKKKVAGKKGL